MKKSLPLLFLLLFPLSTSAAMLFFEVRGPLTENNISRVALFVDTEGEVINAAEGRITLPDTIEFVKTDTGSSAFSLWPTPPQQENGNIQFAGVIPGGLRGERIFLFHLWVRPKQTGNLGTIHTEGLRAFRNDGEGTEVLLHAETEIFVAGEANENEALVLLDLYSPEPFAIEIVRNPLLFDGAYAAVFSATDKGSGIAYFEMQETSHSQPDEDRWRAIESPVRLEDQSRASYVFIRATDGAGNTRVARHAPVRSAWPQSVFYAILSVLLGTALYACFRNRRKTAETIA